MVQLTLQQRVFVVENFFTTKSYVEVQRLFQIEFPNRLPPTTMTIHRNVIKYCQHATSQIAILRIQVEEELAARTKILTVSKKLWKKIREVSYVDVTGWVLLGQLSIVLCPWT